MSKPTTEKKTNLDLDGHDMAINKQAIRKLAKDPECGPIVKYYRGLLSELLDEIDRLEDFIKEQGEHAESNEGSS